MYFTKMPSGYWLNEGKNYQCNSDSHFCCNEALKFQLKMNRSFKVTMRLQISRNVP